jgi:hypothetical protein
VRKVIITINALVETMIVTMVASQSRAKRKVKKVTTTSASRLVIMTMRASRGANMKTRMLSRRNVLATVFAEMTMMISHMLAEAIVGCMTLGTRVSGHL